MQCEEQSLIHERRVRKNSLKTKEFSSSECLSSIK